MYGLALNLIMSVSGHPSIINERWYLSFAISLHAFSKSPRSHMMDVLLQPKKLSSEVGTPDKKSQPDFKLF